MCTFKEMNDLLELGTQMGLKDASLQQFIKDEQARLRDWKKSQGNRGASVKGKEESSRHVRFTEPQSGYNSGYRGRHSRSGRNSQNRKEISVVEVQQPGAVPEMLQSVKGTVCPLSKDVCGTK